MTAPDRNPKRLAAIACLLLAFVAGVFALAVLRLALDPGAEADPAVAENGESTLDRERSTDETSPNAGVDSESPADDARDPAAGDPPENHQGDNGSENNASDAGDNSTPPENADGTTSPQKPSESKTPAVDAKPPWTDQLAAPPEPWRVAALSPFPPDSAMPGVDTLRQWLTTAPQTPAPAIRWSNTSLGRCGGFSGIAQLAPTIDSPTAIRMQLHTGRPFQLHLFHKTNGVSLVRLSSGQWFGYRVSRHGSAPQPARRWLASTDDSRLLRKGSKLPFDVCLLDGAVTLTLGEVEILRVACDGLPNQVYLEGEAAVQGLALRRLSEPPPRLDLQRDWKAVRPVALEWTTNAPHSGQLTIAGDGSATLAVAGEVRPCFAWMSHDDLGLRLIELQLSDIKPGAAVFLGEQGQAHSFIRFVRNTRDGELCAVLRGDHVVELNVGHYSDRQVASIPDSIRLRLAGGDGMLRAWISHNGRNWASLGFASHGKSRIDSIGLSCAPNVETSIRIDTLRTAQLSAIHQLADADLLTRATASSQPDLAVWQVETLASRPTEIDLEAWRRATAVRSLQRWTDREFQGPLLLNLLDETPTRSLQSVLDAALVLNLTADSQRLSGLLSRAEQAVDDAVPLGEVTRRVLMTPWISQHRSVFPSDEFLRQRLLLNIHHRDWEAVADLSRRAEVHDWGSRLPLLPWAESMLTRHAPQLAGRREASSGNRWPEAVVEELDRDAYNVTAELYAALEGENAELAAEIAAAIRDGGGSGLAPAPHDPGLLISVAAALNDLAQQRGDIAQLIAEQHRDLAQLRLQQAIDAADVNGLQTLAEQFSASPIGGRASLWLGDHHLSIGRFAAAAAHYQRAARFPQLAEDAKGRAALAQAMLGKPVDERNSSGVGFSATQYDANDFNQLIGSLVDRHRTQASTQQLPAPAKIEVQFADKLDGLVGKSPNQSLVRESQRYAADWPVRHLATQTADNILYVSNRFQVAAYNLTDGKRRWISENSLGEPLRSQDWFLTQTKPLVDEDAVYCRFLYGPGPLLAKLDRESGKVIWRTQLDGSEFVVSDPWMLESRIWALVVRRGQQNSQLHLAEFDVDTGIARLGRRLFDLRDSWWRSRYCAATPTMGGFVVATSGAVAFCEHEGQPRWLRRRESLPTDLEAAWPQQRFYSPIVKEEAVYHLNPGSRSILAIDVASGRLRWTRMIENALAVEHVGADDVIVRTESSLISLDRDNGSTRWTAPLSDLQEAVTSGESTIAAVHVRAGKRNREATPVLTWIDRSSGRRIHEAALSGLVNSQPYLGPLIPTAKGFLTFYGSGRDDVYLDLLRLEAVSPATEQPAANLDWNQHLDEAVRREIFSHHPGWQLWSGASSEKLALKAQLRGERQVVSLRLDRDGLLAYQRHPHQNGPLRFRVAADAGMDWRLEVRGDGRLLRSMDMPRGQGNPDWLPISVDLPPATEPQWLTVRLSRVDGSTTNVYLTDFVVD